ncbi:MAG: LysM peptidoglycan-binding domain-containing protein [Flavobacteriaceae bacterium]|nr:LysM peptidoglycan-binding domain-containing protein [Flavobacteriaceae bacterium]
MSKILTPLLFTLFFSYAFAQEHSLEEQQSLVSELETSEITEQEPLSLLDSIRAAFQVHQISSEIDSLWKKELYNSELFEEMNAFIKEADTLQEETVLEDLPTELLKERLALLDAKTPFNIAYSPSLENIIKRYLKSRKTSLQRLMNLSNYYFPMFEQELDKHNIPLELKYLAIVESALNPRARSRVGATGLWQFMYPTGKMYGMEVTSYVDERSDPLRATESAAKYLSLLHSMFNDWDLALASYNAGPGNVSRAIRRSGGETNYWLIRNNLPRETAGYVPAFLATMYIFEYAEEHGFKLPKTGLPYYETDTIHIKQTLSFDDITELVDISKEELQFLNPSYKLDVIPFIKGKNYTLRLPLDILGTFVSNEELIYAYVNKKAEENKKVLPEFYAQEQQITYRVKSGDFLGKIANQYGVSVNNIKNWNNLKNNNLRIGQRLTIYPKGQKPNATAVNQSNASNGSTKEYVVRNGDSLWSIAQKLPGVSVDNLKKWNDISGTKLKPGMKLKISKG